jgi:hypothetical protein
MFGQFVYTFLTVMPVMFYYKYKWLHGVVLAAVFGVSTWNGSSFYVEVFGKRFEKVCRYSLGFSYLTFDF